MLDAGKQVALRHTIASQPVGHDRPRPILQTLQKPLEEALRGVGIAPGLNQNVERDTILIDGAPEIVLHAADPDEDFVHVPLVPWPWPASQAVGEAPAEFLAPAPYGLAADDDALLGQKQFDVAQAEAEHVVRPHSMADDLRGEAVAVVRVGWRRRPSVSFIPTPAANPGYRDNAVGM